MTTLDRSATLDPRALEEAARVVAHQNSEILGHDTWGELEDEQRDCLRGEAAEIITAYLAATQPIMEDVPHLIRQAKAEAWEVGRSMGLSDHSASMRAGRPLRTPNPYAEEGQ